MHGVIRDQGVQAKKGLGCSLSREPIGQASAESKQKRLFSWCNATFTCTRQWYCIYIYLFITCKTHCCWDLAPFVRVIGRSKICATVYCCSRRTASKSNRLAPTILHLHSSPTLGWVLVCWSWGRDRKTIGSTSGASHWLLPISSPSSDMMSINTSTCTIEIWLHVHYGNKFSS